MDNEKLKVLVALLKTRLTLFKSQYDALFKQNKQLIELQKQGLEVTLKTEPEVKDQLTQLIELLKNHKFEVKLPVINIPKIDLPSIPEIKAPPVKVEIPDKININRPSWLQEILDAIKSLFKLPTEAKDAIPVRLSDGEKFYEAITQMVGGFVGGSSAGMVNQDGTNVVGGLYLKPYDYLLRVLTNSTTETYTFKKGGASGETTNTVVIVYTDSTLETISTVTKT